MKKTILTSMATILIASPTLAAVGDKTFTPGTMENPGMCVADTTGVSSGTAQTNANWSTNTYTCAAGTYLPDGTNWSGLDDGCAQCTANHYCAGDTFTYSESGDQGIQSCPNGFPSADANSDSANDCYRACTTNDVAHSTAVTGRFYSNETAASNSCEPDGANNGANSCATGYHYVAGISAPDLTTSIGVTQGTGYTSNYSTGSERYSEYMSNTIIANDPMAFAVDYGDGKIIRGHGRCSTRSATHPWVGGNSGYDYVLQSDGLVSQLTDETGQSGAKYCYCQLDGYTLDNGSMQSLSAPWVFNNENYKDCADACAYNCANGLLSDDSQYLPFRAAVFGSLLSTPASCQANEISIQWANGDGTSQSGTCTYDTAIETPATGPTKRGHTFTGWTFVAQ